MTAVRLEFPVLVRVEVRENVRNFVVRPLLAAGKEGVARRFEDALHKCLQAVRVFFKDFRTDRASLDGLLWYLFNPELETRTFELRFRSGQKDIFGSYRAAWFDHGGLRYVCLPGFDGHLFALAPPASGRYRMEEEVDRAVQQLFRKERREKGDQAPMPETHFAADREFVTTAETTVHVEGSPFPFTGGVTKDRFEALLGETATAAGSVEIEKVATDLTLVPPEARLRAIGVDEVVERVGRLLFEDEPVPTVIVGPRGVGKTSIVHEAVARQLATHPKTSIDRLPKVWHLEPNRVIAGQRVVGMWQNRMEAILGFARDRLRQRYSIPRPDALFVDNPVALLRVGKSSQNEMTLGDLMKPWLEKREVILLLEATPEGWKAIQDLDRGFADLFRVIRVQEPDLDTALRIVARQRMILERDLRCTIDESALMRLLEVHRAWPQRRVLPGGVIGPLKQVAGKHRRAHIGAIQVDSAFQSASRMSKRIFDPTEKLTDDQVRTFIEERLAGQSGAVQNLIDTIHLAKARLGDPERPLSSLLFIGPTGVGKTEAAKVLAQFLFDDPDSLIRFDMNEYVDAGAVGRLIGGGGSSEGQLTERVRHRPFSVLLFDEIEKADPSVHDLLLQVLGEGRLTDSLGRTADFSACIVIMTSNLGAGDARRTVGFGEAEASRAQAYRKAVEEFFRPEFVNRIDRVVDFGPLGLDEVKRIARIQVRRFLERDGFIRRQTFLDVSERALGRIAEFGFDPDMGGRALKRSLEKEVAVMAAERLNALPPDDPLLIEVFQRGPSLFPRVTPLPPVAAREGPPAFVSPEKEGLRDFYQGLLEIAREIETELRGLPEMVLRSKIVGVRQKLQERLYEFQDRIPRVLGMTDGSRRDIATVDGGNLRAAFARLDLRGYIDELYRSAPVEQRQSQDDALDVFRELAAAEFSHRVRSAGTKGGTCIHLRPLVGDRQKSDWVSHLAGRYGTLLSAFDPDWQVQSVMKDDPAGELYLHARAVDLTGLLRSEEGVHLFYPAHRGGVPVRLRALSLPEGANPLEFIRSDATERSKALEGFERGDGTDPAAPSERAVRIYCPPGPGSEGTVTDLATGQIAPYMVPEATWFLWVYGGLPASERIVFDG